MRQVPIKSKTPYLIIGNGKLAKHLTHYFQLLDINFLTWSRQSLENLTNLISLSNKIIILINDVEIEKFISKHRAGFEEKIWIHCSGSLTIPFAIGVHPLMTFTNELYDIETYKQIPFVTEKGKKKFNQLFPELSNPAFQIKSELKPFYHAWCVMSGNFTTIIWQNFFEVLELRFGINRKNAFPYLNAITRNLLLNKSSLTGPLQRNDKKVIEKNMLALKNDPFADVYKSFVKSYKKSRKI